VKLATALLHSFKELLSALSRGQIGTCITAPALYFKMKADE
jgi:hypothetical protein